MTTDYTQLAGYRYQKRSPVTSLPVVVYSAAAQGLDATDDRWITVCEGHGDTVASATLALAIDAARTPHDWCDSCRDGHDHTEDTQR